MAVAPTPRDLLHRDGSAQLYRFRRAGTPRPAEAEGAVAAPAEPAPREPPAPLLVVPSLINRWYVVDLREGASLVGALVEAGIDTYCLDWGVPQDEDRWLGWDDVLGRLARAVRAVRRVTGAPRVALLGYCMGGTLAAIHAALHDRETAALVNLAGPIDFAAAGLLGELVSPAWFDAEAIASAGNVSAAQMQGGFVALRPTGSLAKWVAFPDRGLDPAWREGFHALETWASDNIPFPAAAYVTYIRELYQENRLCRGAHRVAGRAVDLGAIRAPVLTVTAGDDRICPPAAALALNDLCGSTETTSISIPGGHVGAVVGPRAPKRLYPAIVSWLRAHA